MVLPFLLFFLGIRLVPGSFIATRERKSVFYYTCFVSFLFSLSARSQTKGCIMNTTYHSKSRIQATAGPITPGVNAVLSVVEVRGVTGEPSANMVAIASIGC